MSILDRIVGLKDQFLDDGSKELLDVYMEAIEDEGEAQALLANTAFKKMLEAMRRDFKQRMYQIVEEDPELKQIKNVFLRTIGKQGAEKQIEKILDEFIDESDEVSEPYKI